MQISLALVEQIRAGAMGLNSPRTGTTPQAIVHV